MACANLNECGFFKKYKSVHDLACEGFVLQYCEGPHENECKRKEFKEKNGRPPSDDMMPTGSFIPTDRK